MILLAGVLVAAVTTLAAGTFTPAASAETVSGDLLYTSSGSAVTIRGCNGTCPESVTIPATIEGMTVTTIGAYAFEGVTGLVNIYLPDTLTSIEGYAFSGASTLVSIAIPSGVTRIRDHTFFSATKLTTVTLPPALTSIDQYAFAQTSSLVALSLPSGLTTIGQGAFQAGGLTTVAIPNGVITISFTAFSSMPALTEVTFGAGSLLTTIDYGAFQEDTALRTIAIPSGVTSVLGYSFDGASDLTSIDIPSGVASIGAGAFRNATSLRTVTLHDGLESLGSSAFSGNRSLEIITIPSTLTDIGDRAFSGDSSLLAVMFKGNAPTVGTDAFTDVSAGAAAYRRSELTGYGADNDSFHGLIVSPSYAFTYIDDGASVTVTGCAEDPCAATLTIPSSIGGHPVTKIANYAFSGSTSLTSVNFEPNSALTTIGDSAFHNCTSLTNFTIPSSVTRIGYVAFWGADALATVTFLGNAPLVGGSAFAGVDPNATAHRTVNLTGYGSAGDDFHGLTVTDPPNNITAAKATNKIAKALITFTTLVTVPGDGKLSQTITSKTRRKTTTWCTAKATTTTAHAYTLTCKITKAGRAALRKAAMKLTLTTSFTPTGGTKATKTQVVKLARTR